MRKGAVISDLHYLSERSVFDQRNDEVFKVLKNSDAFVLNGDIFDFRWSTYSSLATSVKRAIEWLEHFVAEARSDCRIFYNLGNHDCSPAFISELEKFAKKQDNFFWHPHYLKLSKNLFIHGDAIHAASGIESLENYRKKFHHEECKGKVSNYLYTAALKMKLPGALSSVLPRRTLAERILRFLESENVEIDEVENIYFGHTHLSFEGLHYRGKVFYNTGALVYNTPWQMFEFEF